MEEIEMGEDVVKNLAVLSSVILMVSPFFDDIKQIKTEKRTKDKSPTTFLILWLSCVIWTIYGVFTETYHPIVSTNIIGIICSTYFLYIFHYYSSVKEKKNIESSIKYMIVVINMVLLYVIFLPESIEITKLRLGIFGSMLSVSMYGSSSLNIVKVVNTKDPSHISVGFSVLGSLSSYLWYMFGQMINDIWVFGPNFLGLALSLSTIITWTFYTYGYPFIQGYRQLKASKDDGEYDKKLTNAL